MKRAAKKKDQAMEIRELRLRLSEAEELLSAIKSGTVDALITDDRKVFTLKGADHAYRVFVDTMNEGAATLSLAGTVMYCNERLVKMLKASSEEITGNPIFKFVHPDDLGNFKILLKRGCSSSSSSSRGNITFLNKDGKELSVNIACNPLRLEQDLVCAVFTDVSKLKAAQRALEKLNLELESKVKDRTEALRSANDELNAGNQELAAINEELANSNEKLRKETEERLRSEGRFRALTETSSIAVGVSLSDGKFLYINRAYEKLFGYTQKELDRLNASELWRNPEDRRTMIDAVRSKGFLLDYEVELRRKDKTLFWAMLSVNSVDYGGTRAIMASVYDITARKQAEEALLESEEKYRNLFENMIEEVHFWKVVRDGKGRIKTWRLVDANPPALKSWGKGAIEEIRGKTTDEIFGPGSTEHYRAVAEKIMSERLPHSFEDYFPQLDKYFRFTSVPLGEYFINTGTDITDIKKAEQSLRASNEELTRFNRAMVDREMRVIELKKRINELSEEAGKPAPYKSEVL